MRQSYLILDVFTDTPLTGNALAVFTDAATLDCETMQRVARELNLSETVFLTAPDDEQTADVRARIFTPTAELPFAGHPVLGTAFVIAQRTSAETVRIQTAASIVAVHMRRHNNQVVFGEMEQPLPQIGSFDAGEALLRALKLERSELPLETYANGPVHIYVTLARADDVRALRPDLGALESLGPYCISCFAQAGGRVKTRMFGPGVGIPEDPATGSAAGPLALHLARHGRIDFGDQLEIEQGAEIGRPSLMHARVEGKRGGGGAPSRLERILVGGSAVGVASGEFRLG